MRLKIIFYFQAMPLLPPGLSGWSSNLLDNLGLMLSQDHWFHFCCNFFSLSSSQAPFISVLLKFLQIELWDLLPLCLVHSSSLHFLLLILKFPTQPIVFFFFFLVKNPKCLLDVISLFLFYSLLTLLRHQSHQCNSWFIYLFSPLAFKIFQDQGGAYLALYSQYVTWFWVWCRCVAFLKVKQSILLDRLYKNGKWYHKGAQASRELILILAF